MAPVAVMLNLRAGARQQLTAEITNVGDPRLEAEQPTACHQLRRLRQ